MKVRPSPDGLIFHLAVVLRRVLVLVDKRSSAARAARSVLRQADRFLAN